VAHRPGPSSASPAGPGEGVQQGSPAARLLTRGPGTGLGTDCRVQIPSQGAGPVRGGRAGWRGKLPGTSTGETYAHPAVPHKHFEAVEGGSGPPGTGTGTHAGLYSATVLIAFAIKIYNVRR
jgi:hypothetical protein